MKSEDKNTSGSHIFPKSNNNENEINFEDNKWKDNDAVQFQFCLVETLGVISI